MTVMEIINLLRQYSKLENVETNVWTLKLNKTPNYRKFISFLLMWIEYHVMSLTNRCICWHINQSRSVFFRLHHYRIPTLVWKNGKHHNPWNGPVIGNFHASKCMFTNSPNASWFHQLRVENKATNLFYI